MRAPSALTPDFLLFLCLVCAAPLLFFTQADPFFGSICLLLVLATFSLWRVTLETTTQHDKQHTLTRQLMDALHAPARLLSALSARRMSHPDLLVFYLCGLTFMAMLFLFPVQDSDPYTQALAQFSDTAPRHIQMSTQWPLIIFTALCGLTIGLCHYYARDITRVRAGLLITVPFIVIGLGLLNPVAIRIVLPAWTHLPLFLAFLPCLWTLGRLLFLSRHRQGLAVLGLAYIFILWTLWACGMSHPALTYALLTALGFCWGHAGYDSALHPYRHENPLTKEQK